MINCPVCRSILTFDEVDIGVGTLTGNYRCDSCGWFPGLDEEPIEIEDSEPEPDDLEEYHKTEANDHKDAN